MDSGTQGLQQFTGFFTLVYQIVPTCTSGEGSSIHRETPQRLVARGPARRVVYGQNDLSENNHGGRIWTASAVKPFRFEPQTDSSGDSDPDPGDENVWEGGDVETERWRLDDRLSGRSWQQTLPYRGQFQAVSTAAPVPVPQPPTLYLHVTSIPNVLIAWIGVRVTTTVCLWLKTEGFHSRCSPDAPAMIVFSSSRMETVTSNLQSLRRLADNRALAGEHRAGQI
ncbi:hypothetical protein Bbelb_054990 [Branchiostoma belcheri]|nr:hypothetical protein Bbelb_054990 [Branchiostoma belcheri]